MMKQTDQSSFFFNKKIYSYTRIFSDRPRICGELGTRPENKIEFTQELTTDKVLIAHIDPSC